MQKFKLAKSTEDPIYNWLISFYNKFMHKLAHKAGENMAILKNKAIYGIEVYNAIHVMTSKEKKDIDIAMPKGNRMNIASTLEHQTFIIYPETARRDKLKNGRKRFLRKKYT